MPRSVYTLSSLTPSSPAHLTVRLRVSNNARLSLRLFADLSPIFLLREGNDKAICRGIEPRRMTVPLFKTDWLTRSTKEIKEKTK